MLGKEPDKRAALVCLGELASLVTKGTTPKTIGRSYQESGVPFLRSEDIQGGRVNWSSTAYHISQDTHDTLARSQIKNGDLLITIAGTIGRVGFVDDLEGPLNCNQAVAIVRLESPRVNVRFVCYALQSESALQQIQGNKTTATIPNMSLQQVRGLKIPLPPLAEQQRIVEILDRAAAIQRLRRAAEEKAREIIPALFVDMFGDPATNPKGWPLATIGDVLQRIETGKNVMAGSGRSPFRILKVSAVTSGIYNEQESKPTPDNFEPDARSIVRVGDFLFSRANTAELVGATTIVNSSDGLTLLPDKLWRLVWSERVEATYMLGVLQNRTVRAAISREASGTSASMRNVSQGKLLGIRFALAPPELQRIYADHSAALAGVAKLTLNASQYAHALQHAVTTATLTEA